DPHRLHRWPANLGFGIAGALCLRLLMPWLAIDAAVWARQNHVGLLHLWPLPSWLAIILTLVALDLLIYGQHRLMHRVGWLWRLHRVHHSDVALDVSSGVRFHPLEILFSMGLKIAAVLALGAAPAAVLEFEILLNGFAMFTHANLALPLRLDRALRWMVITPDMHRIHHSVLRDEQDTNFGFNVSWWDRLFRSYRAAPRQPQASLPLGLDQFRDRHEQRFDQLLLQPFRHD
ncbi:MAG: sterol desaturase family protein, partial [Pseudomonadota bacterium]|nr:sterol desaturase family protein [Pseudomonadota bacterium]